MLVDAIAETIQTLLTPEQWAQYNRLVLVAPPPALAGYRNLSDVRLRRQLRADARAAVAAAAPAAVRRVVERAVIRSAVRPAGGLGDAIERAWQGSQDYLAALLPDTRHVVVAESSHYIQIERPQVVVDAVEQVVDAVRHGSPATSAS